MRDVPSCIDFEISNNYYGEPCITTEEVEGMYKTFLCILLLILLCCLLGFHLSGCGYSLSYQLMRKECPSLCVLMMVAKQEFHFAISLLFAAVRVIFCTSWWKWELHGLLCCLHACWRKKIKIICSNSIAIPSSSVAYWVSTYQGMAFCLSKSFLTHSMCNCMQ